MTGRLSVRRLALMLALLVVASCGREARPLDPIGFWYPVEINGAPVHDTRIRLELEDLDPKTQVYGRYELGVHCSDQGRYDATTRAYVSDHRTNATPPQDQCLPEDAARQDALRHMTHQGVALQIDQTSQSLTLSTTAGQSARFAFMDMTPVD